MNDSWYYKVFEGIISIGQIIFDILKILYIHEIMFLIQNKCYSYMKYVVFKFIDV